MGGVERINQFIQEKGFYFEVSEHDIDSGFHTVRTNDGGKVWYKLVNSGDLVACFFGDWRSGENHKCYSKDAATADEKRNVKKWLKQLDEEREERYLVAKGLAEELWVKFQREAVKENSHYLEGKKLTPSDGCLVVRGDTDNQRVLVIPCYDEAGELWNIQQVYRAGGKYFNKSARTSGLFHVIRGTTEKVYVGEGYATCRAFNQATGATVYVAFSAKNLEAVLRVAIRNHGPVNVQLLADWDGEAFEKTGKNTGMFECQVLAVKHRLLVCCPIDLGEEHPNKKIDFADLWDWGEWSVKTISWERLSQFTFKIEKDKPKKDVVVKENKGREEQTESVGGEEKQEPIALLEAPAQKLAVDHEPDDADFASKSNGFFMQVPKTRPDGTPVLGSDGPVMRDVPDYDCLSRYLGRRFFLKTNDAFSYLYGDAHYSLASVGQIKHLTRVLVKKNTSPNMVSAFVEDARSANFIRADQLVGPVGLINLKNGILDVRTRKLMDHSPEYFFKYRLGHEYQAGVECPEWLAFLERTFEGNQELASVCAEIFGYILLGGEPFLHKAFVFLGEGRNGKSTVLEVLKFLLGATNYSTIPLPKLDKPFSAVMADGKLANITGEVTNKEISSDAFKLAVGGEELIASQKGRDEYSLPFHARLIVASNKFPSLGDNTTGAYDKFFILPFNRFIPENERTMSYARKKLFPEISGIINWSLDGLERLVKRGGLPRIEAVKEQTTQLRLSNDTAYAWFTEFAEFDKTSTQRIQPRDYYGHYSQWCREQGRYPMSLGNFSSAISAEVRKHPNTLTHKPKNVFTITGGVTISTKAVKGLPVLALLK